MVDDEPGSGGGEEHDQLGHVGGDGDEQLLQLGLGGVGAGQHTKLEHGAGGEFIYLNMLIILFAKNANL